MDFLAVVVQQVLVLFLMLVGIMVGDVVASSMFGRIRGSIKQISYLLLFVVFLVMGNYVPAFLGIPHPSPTVSIVLFGFWGFLSVFVSRVIIYLTDVIRGQINKIMKHGGAEHVVELREVIDHLSPRLEMESIKKVLMQSTPYPKKIEKIFKKVEDKGMERGEGEIQVYPTRLSRSLMGEGLGEDEILDVLIKILGIQPEKAVRIVRDYLQV